MVTMGVFPFQGKTHMVEPGIEPGTSWLVVRSSDHQATRLVREDQRFNHENTYIPLEASLRETTEIKCWMYQSHPVKSCSVFW